MSSRYFVEKKFGGFRKIIYQSTKDEECLLLRGLYLTRRREAAKKILELDRIYSPG